MIDVEWTDTARDQLADLWITATPDERILFERQILELEKELRKNPLAVGQARHDGNRVAVVPPLIVWFRVESRVRNFRVSRIGRG